MFALGGGPAKHVDPSFSIPGVPMWALPEEGIEVLCICPPLVKTMPTCVARWKETVRHRRLRHLGNNLLDYDLLKDRAHGLRAHFAGELDQLCAQVLRCVVDIRCPGVRGDGARGTDAILRRAVPSRAPVGRCRVG